jgi:sulfur carrier protein
MTVVVNGTALELAEGGTLAELIEQVAGSLRGSAAVVDDEVVPRGEWAAYELRPGQRGDVITAKQGG